MLRSVWVLYLLPVVIFQHLLLLGLELGCIVDEFPHNLMLLIGSLLLVTLDLLFKAWGSHHVFALEALRHRTLLNLNSVTGLSRWLLASVATLGLQTIVIRCWLIRRLLRLPLDILVCSLHSSLRRFGAVIHRFYFCWGGWWIEALVWSGLSWRPILSLVRRTRPIIALVDCRTVI